MVPNFALSLSSEGIALLRRVSGGWAPAGEVAFDSDDLDSALAELRARAEALSPDGAQVAVILPDGQLRYLDLPDPGEGDTARDDAARTALDGATPYAVEELFFDWSLIGPRLCVCAVAHETIEEAGGFLAAHGFTPVSYLALPPEGAFDGVVFFGAAPGWTGAAPERPESFEIVAAPPEPEAAAPAEVPPLPETPDIETADPAPDPAAALVDEAGQASSAAPVPELPQSSGLTAPAPNKPPAEPAPVAFAGGSFGKHGAPARGTDSPVATAHRPVAPREEGGEAPSAPSFSSIRATRDAPAGAVQAPRLDTARPNTERPAPEPGAAPAPTPASEGLFARRGRKGVADLPPPPKPQAPKPAAKPKPKADRLRAPQPKVETPKPARAPAPAETPQQPAAPAVTATAAAPEPAKPPLSGPARLAAMRRRNETMAAEAAASSAAATAAIDEERERMTVFGARGNEQIGGKPRYLGLMLTAALLLFLAGVAAWASVFLDEGLARFFGPRQEVETEVAAVPAEALPQESPVDTAPETEAEADTELAALDMPESASDAPDTPAPLAQPQTRRMLSSEEAAATYAATGIWQRAPTAPLEPPQTGTEDIYVASIDPQVEQLDAVALPDFTAPRGDLNLPPVPLPPGPFERFDLDERGLVRATPEGALSPDGIRIYTGRPPQVPPLRNPADAPDALPESAPDGAAPEAATDPAQEALEQIRPKTRPGDLVEQTERATLGGISVAELSQRRPQIRPQSAQEQAQEQAIAEQQGDLGGAIAEAVAEAQDGSTEEAALSATDQAVARSLAPLPRPRNIDELVQRAAPIEEVETASAGPVRIQPGPSVPQNTNVARSATVRNQINLRRVSLIGIYGKPSSRRALVRLPSGRYQKVKVGDRVDGGRVAAIGESELQYTKGGRNIVLSMPRG